MKPVLKEIYLDIEKHLKAYGYKLYKGKIWKYDPIIGYVIGIEVEVTRWGTLNDIYVCVSSYRTPIKQNDISAKKEPLPSTWLKTCMLYRRREGVSVYAMGSPYQSVDITLKQQYDAMLPFLEKLQIMQGEAYIGIECVMDTSMALEYCYYHDPENALRIMDLYKVYCDAEIESFGKAAKHLPPEDRQRITDAMEQRKAEAISFAKTIQSEPETIRRMIEENTAISEKNCGSFFTSRFFSR